MANLFDYITWRGDLDFNQVPFNPVDNIIFCQFSYLPLDGIVYGPDEKKEIGLSRVAHIFNEKRQNTDAAFEKSLLFKDDPALLNAMGSSARYGNCRVCGYINHIDENREMQISAVSILTGDGSCCIVYRGTDLTLVGWKEDFNMFFHESVPAQLAAADYLEKMAARIKGPLRVGGHSKGGNLAVYAASQCSPRTQKRITAVFSNDAPGFHETVIASNGYAAISSRIQSFVPQGSVVGMVLEHDSNYTVIKSTQFGLRQHELYSWEVIHNDMVQVDSVSHGSRFIDKTIREWIYGLDIEHREQFFEALYTILSESEAKSLRDFEGAWFMAAGRMIKSLRNIDESTKALIRKTLAALVSSARRNINTLLKPV